MISRRVPASPKQFRKAEKVKMDGAQLNLVVIRSSDAERAVRFYQVLGLEFGKHRHGSGPEHYAAELGAAVFEIYSQCNELDRTVATRLGFRVPCIDSVVAELGQVGATIVSMPHHSDWGRRAVVEDPDGHRVELTQG